MKAGRPLFNPTEDNWVVDTIDARNKTYVEVAFELVSTGGYHVVTLVIHDIEGGVTATQLDLDGVTALIGPLERYVAIFTGEKNELDGTKIS